mmetsp:Transcript_73337/g.203492  ORF Transcript_73337/g.203492 Transcript_73337/m.203492 type:complete len:952 (-) Transcript_73337:88-2943(-)
MGGCCGRGGGDGRIAVEGEEARNPGEDPEKNRKLEKGSKRDFSRGIATDRTLQDIPCLILYLLYWIVFVVITFYGVQDGNPWKLVRPRDFRGDFCGIAGQWNNPGLSYEEQKFMTFTMNVSASAGMIAKQLVCSSVSEDALKTILTTDEMEEYRCACCKSACRSCMGSLSMQDLTSPAALRSTISGRMGELTNPGLSTSLFSTEGANGDVFSNMWSEATRYFQGVCTTDCNSVTLNTTRNYTYSPSPELPWKTAWDTLATNAAVPEDIRQVIESDFMFHALDPTACPYHPRYCVPFPGIRFTELETRHCMFTLSDEVTAIVSDAATTALQGAEKVTTFAQEGLGAAVGDIISTLDCFFIVSVFAFIVGLIFLVMLRFVVGCVVWSSLVLVFLFLLIGGSMAYVRSSQCAGSTLSSTTQAGVSSVAVAAQFAAAAALAGNRTASESYDMEYGEDYRGAQTRTQSGRTCQAWAAQEPHEHTTTPEDYPDADLRENFCRNPEEAPGIWCFTTDLEKRWELCSPIGVFLPECPNGYVVDDPQMRQILKIMAYVIWAFAAIWMLVVCCLASRIKLAIEINKVAADFIVSTPSVIFVPLVQILVAVIWCLVWAFSVAFLLSQVPADHTPTAAFATYAEAVGTHDVPGKCTGSWPTGFAWHDEGDLDSTDDPCSGNRGDTSALEGGPRCWRCAPPRYIIDPRAFASLFAYLWNNALLIAIGQCVIAGAVGIWFTTPEKDRRGYVVKTSLGNVFRYHLGSLAFGAFILALIQLLRYLMNYFEKQAKAQKNRIAACVFKVIRYILWCFEKCVQFLNKNAYIQIALIGENFCKSAKEAFYLITRNLLRFGAVAILGSIIQFIGFIFITIAVAGIGWLVLTSIHPDVSPVMPMILYVSLGYIAARLYMNVFCLSVDTSLQCFIAVEEMGDDADVYVPKSLRQCGLLKKDKNNDNGMLQFALG